MNTYHLLVVTPAGKVFEGEAQSLVAPGVEGSFGVLAGHAPMIVGLKKGPLTLKTKDQTRHFTISPGILEISGQNRALLLSDEIVENEPAEEAKLPVTH